MDHSPLSHSIAAMVRRESVQAHRELDRRQEQLQQLLDYNQTHDLDPRLTEGFYRCLRTALQLWTWPSGTFFPSPFWTPSPSQCRPLEEPPPDFPHSVPI